MEITWLGHSCFRLRGNNVTLLTDPFIEDVGFPFPSVSARVVTVSNDHPHHSNWVAVEGSPRVLRGPGEYEVGGVFINSLRTPAQGDQVPPNTAYLVEMDGLTLCHLGDVSQPLSARLVEELGRAQVLFIPVGGHCTLPLAQVAEVITQLEPRLVIPMHFKVEGCAVDLEPVDAFLRELGIQEPSHQPRISVTSSGLPRELQVIVPERAS